MVMYSVKARHVVSQYYVTSNMSLDGIAEFLDKKSTMTEFGPLADISKEEELKVAGQKKTDRSLRRFEGEKSIFMFKHHFDPLLSTSIHFKSKLKCILIHFGSYRSILKRGCV